MNIPHPISFKDFLSKFPLSQPPITITEESHHDFSRLNDPLPFEYIDQMLNTIESDIDEYTEIVPCFRIEDPQQFYGIVYWRAKLMTYDYFLVTYSWKGEFVEKVRIGGTKYKDNQVLISISTISEDWIIDILEGISQIEVEYDSSNSRAYYIEILEGGKILSPSKNTHN